MYEGNDSQQSFRGPIPIIACCKTEQIGAGVIQSLKPEDDGAFPCVIMRFLKGKETRQIVARSTRDGKGVAHIRTHTRRLNLTVTFITFIAIHFILDGENASCEISSVLSGEAPPTSSSHLGSKEIPHRRNIASAGHHFRGGKGGGAPITTGPLKRLVVRHNCFASYSPSAGDKGTVAQGGPNNHNAAAGPGVRKEDGAAGQGVLRKTRGRRQVQWNTWKGVSIPRGVNHRVGRNVFGESGISTFKLLWKPPPTHNREERLLKLVLPFPNRPASTGSVAAASHLTGKCH